MPKIAQEKIGAVAMCGTKHVLPLTTKRNHGHRIWMCAEDIDFGKAPHGKLAVTNSSEGPVTQEVPIRMARSSRHKARHRKRVAVKFVLVLALVVGGLAVFHFAYNAYVRADCYTADETAAWGNTKPAVPKSGECSAEIDRRDELLRLDASAALVAVAFLMGSIVVSRRMKRHRR